VVISQFLSIEIFLSPRVLVRRLATSSQPIKEILTRDLRMRKLTRRWMRHELRATDKAKRVVDARTLLQALRNDSSQNFSQITTGDENWFYYNYELRTMFARARDEVVPRVSPTIESKKVMVTIFFTGNRLVKLVSLRQGQKCHKEYFISEIFEGINQECNHGRGYSVIKTMKIHSSVERWRVLY
jgi:hypothetical protein